MASVEAPILTKLILPSLTREQVESLIGAVESARDKAIVALFAESGLRLTELASIRASDINLQDRTIRILWGRAGKRL